MIKSYYVSSARAMRGEGRPSSFRLGNAFCHPGIHVGLGRERKKERRIKELEKGKSQARTRKPRAA